LAPVLDRQSQIDALSTDIKTLLATDIAWERMINRITKDLPAGISLTAFSGTSIPPAPLAVAPPAAASDTGTTTETTTTPTTVAPPPPVVNGTVTFQGTAPDYPTLAAWIDSMNKVPEIADIYVTSAQRVTASADGSGGGLTFSGTAVPSPAAQSNRVGTYVKAAR
jgi:hypothetical protein